MGTSEISGIGNLFTPGQPAGSTGSAREESLTETFQNVMNQMQTPAQGSFSEQKQTVDRMDTDYKRQQTGGVKIREESGMDTGGQEQLSAKLEEFAEDVKEVLKEELGISDEQLAEAMETLGLSFADLLNPNQLAALVIQLTGGSDMGALLCSEQFMTILHTVGELTENLAQELGMSQEELTELLTQMQSDAQTQPQTGEDVVIQPDGEDTAAVSKETQTGDDAAPVVQQEQTAEQENSTDGQEMAVISEETPENADANGGQKNQNPAGQMQEHMGTQTRNDMAGTVGSNITETAFAQVQEQVNGAGTQVDVADIIKQIVEFSRVTLTRTSTTMEMQLNPENLGKLYLQLSAKDGVVSAHITAQNEAVKEALESQLVQFKENMNEAGVKVDAVEVTVSSHEFEKNLEQNAKQDERQAEEQEKAAKGTRHINLNDLDGLSGLLTEEESLVAQMMAEQGNSIDFTA